MSFNTLSKLICAVGQAIAGAGVWGWGLHLGIDARLRELCCRYLPAEFYLRRESVGFAKTLSPPYKLMPSRPPRRRRNRSRLWASCRPTPDCCDLIDNNSDRLAFAALRAAESNGRALGSSDFSRVIELVSSHEGSGPPLTIRPQPAADRRLIRPAANRLIKSRKATPICSCLAAAIYKQKNRSRKERGCFMETSGGMEFWVNDRGRIRLFIVAEPDKSKAQALLRDRLPGIEFTTWQPLPSGVITMLKMPTGEVLEWSPAGSPRGRSM